MASRQSLRNFLAAARTALSAPAAQRPNPLTFVVGNESADIDSLCSAVIFAYLRSNSPPHTLHIPLSNLPRADLALRTEMTAVLRHAGLSLTDLLTLSELPELDPKDTRWFLVDHNSLTGPLRKFSDRVVGCVDHHADEGAIAKDANPRVVEPCGSCASLVIDEARKAWDSLPRNIDDGSDAAEEDEKLAMLALAPILTDTINLTAKEKVKPKDPKSAGFLIQKLGSKEFDSTAYYEEITKVKEDISDLSFRDIFRKDYKEWEEQGLTLGISCVVQDFNYLVSRAQAPDVLISEFSEWVRERNLDVAGIMTTSNPSGEFQRHLLVWGLTDGGKAAVDKFLGTGRGLDLHEWEGGVLDDEKEKRFAWRQKNLASSRKQVAPLLREAMKWG